PSASAADGTVVDPSPRVPRSRSPSAAAAPPVVRVAEDGSGADPPPPESPRATPATISTATAAAEPARSRTRPATRSSGGHSSSGGGGSWPAASHTDLTTTCSVQAVPSCQRAKVGSDSSLYQPGRATGPPSRTLEW